MISDKEINKISISIFKLGFNLSINQIIKIDKRIVKEKIIEEKKITFKYIREDLTEVI